MNLSVFSYYAVRGAEYNDLI